MAEDKPIEDNSSTFEELRKQAKKTTKKRGLKTPPKQEKTTKKIVVKENSPAAPVEAVAKRTHRVSTFIYEDHGELIDELIIRIKRKDGKKPSIGQILEKGIELLDKKYK